MPRPYWRNRYSRSRRPLESERVKPPVDPLYEAAREASERRNQLNYAWVADIDRRDVRPGDAERRKLAHTLKLIELVGEADKAWRAYRASRGEEYGTTPSNTPADLGWLPRYTERAESLRLQIRAIEAAESSGALAAVDQTCDCGEPLTSSGACSAGCESTPSERDPEPLACNCGETGHVQCDMHGPRE